MEKSFTFSINSEDPSISELADLTHRSNTADIIMDAIQLYYLFAKRRLDGKRIFVGKSKDKLSELEISTFNF